MDRMDGSKFELKCKLVSHCHGNSFFALLLCMKLRLTHLKCIAYFLTREETEWMNGLD